MTFATWVLNYCCVEKLYIITVIWCVLQSHNNENWDSKLSIKNTFLIILFIFIHSLASKFHFYVQLLFIQLVIPTFLLSLTVSSSLCNLNVTWWVSNRNVCVNCKQHSAPPKKDKIIGENTFLRRPINKSLNIEHSLHFFCNGVFMVINLI